MATMIQGFCTTFGSASSTAARLRSLAAESQLWTSGYSGSIGDDSGGFGHDGELTAIPNEICKQFNVASAYAILGFEGRGMGGGAGSKYVFNNSPVSNTEIGGIYIQGANIVVQLGGATIGTGINALPSLTTYYTVEFAFGTTGGFVVCETRVNGSRIPALTTSNFTASSGQSAGTMSTSIAAAGTAMTHAWVNFDTLGGPKLYYWWQKNHSALWTSVPTGGTAFVDQSDFNGIKKKFMLTPDSIAAPFNTYVIGGANTWTNGAGTHPSNLADAAIDDTLYIQNQTDGGGVTNANNRIGHGYSNLPAAATRVGMVQRTLWARVFQTTSGILGRTGIRSAATDSPASTDFFDQTTATSPAFGQTYSPGATSGGGTTTASIYYPKQGTLAQYTTGGTDVWSVASVNAIHGIFETVDIL